MSIALYVILLLLMLVGLFVNLLGLPGLWLMVIAYVGFALATGWNVYVGLPSVIAVVLLALAAEAAEFFAGAAGSAAAGGRKRGMVGALAGGLIGGILGTPVLPIVGTVIGACAGAFVGAAAFEFMDRDAAHSIRVGVGAAKGRFWGILSKLLFGLIMFAVAAYAALPYGTTGK
jgi:uncharacterized protein YqgC (DUF456 family)